MANIEDLDDDFILCNVCNNEYDEDQRAPKLLPCLHTLCNDCALNASQGSLLKCAICQVEHPLSSDLKFVKDSTMKNMVDIIKLQRKSSSILCSDCPDGNNGEGFCKDCYVFLCAECTNAHRRTQITRRHTILSLDELKSSGIGSFSKKEMCQLEGHEDQPFSFYCESEECQKPVCTQCVVGDHSQATGHVIRNLSEVYDENKILVERLVGELLTKISEVSSDAKALENESGTIEEKHADLNKEVDDLFDSLEAMLKKRREQLKERVDVICQERKNVIIEQLTLLQKNKSDMENSCNYSSRMLVFTNKPEFLSLKQVVLSKLNSLVEEEIEATRPEPLELTFEACVQEDRFEEVVNSIGEVKTNVYGQDDKLDRSLDRSSLKTNGTIDATEQYKLPYKGPPINPPGKYTTNKYSSDRYSHKPTKDVRTTPKVEPLKLNLLNSDSSSRSPPVGKGSPPIGRGSSAKTTPSPVEENVLGRPLSLKSPVISTKKQPTSLGEFLNALHHSTKEILQEKRIQWILEAQEQSGELDRQPLKAPPSPQIITPTKSSPLTSPMTSPFTSSKGYQSPPSRDMTPSSKYSMKSPTVNGSQSAPSYIQQSSRFAKTSSVGLVGEHSSVPRLDLSHACPPSPERKLKYDSTRIKGLTKPGNITNNDKDMPMNAEKEQKQTKERPKSKLGVSWKLEEKDNSKETGDLASPKSPGRHLTEKCYQDVKQPSPRKTVSQSDKPTVFGDTTCPDFLMDVTSAHHEREVSSDGRTLRNKKSDMFGGGSSIDLENSLVQYKGAIGQLPIKDQGKVYYEVDVVYNIQQPLEETWLVFEIGICRLDDIDMHHTVERHEYARSFYVARYPEDGKLTQEFWHNRDLLHFSPLSDNEAGIEVRITYGFLVDTKKRKWIVADCNNNKVLHTFDTLDFSEALYPVFGCYNPDLCTVEMTLKTGSEITMIPQCLKQPGFR